MLVRRNISICVLIKLHFVAFFMKYKLTCHFQGFVSKKNYYQITSSQIASVLMKSVNGPLDSRRISFIIKQQQFTIFFHHFYPNLNLERRFCNARTRIFFPTINLLPTHSRRSLPYYNILNTVIKCNQMLQYSEYVCGNLRAWTGVSGRNHIIKFTIN